MGGRRQSDVDCRTVVRRLSDYIDGRIDDETRSRIEDHLTRCDSCVALFTTTRQMLDMLGNTNSFLNAIDKYARTPDGALPTDGSDEVKES
jgi:anti-sigma factor RsiW